MYLGKKNLKSLADKIKGNHLNMVYSQFKKTICSEEDCTGYGLYLQIQNLDILPKTETVVYMIQGIVEVADFVVTLSSLFTIFQSLQAQLI